MWIFGGRIGRVLSRGGRGCDCEPKLSGRERYPNSTWAIACRGVAGSTAPLIQIIGRVPLQICRFFKVLGAKDNQSSARTNVPAFKFSSSTTTHHATDGFHQLSRRTPTHRIAPNGAALFEPSLMHPPHSPRSASASTATCST